MCRERSTSMAQVRAGLVEYRFERRGDTTILVFHGGHVRAGLPIGENNFAAAGYSILAPSRPGYGRTPLGTGRSPAGFADVTAQLCEQLGIRAVAAVVGISGGGPTALTMAARHPDLVQRLILESAVGFLPWPDRGIRLAARAMLNSFTERITWTVAHRLIRVAPAAGLRFMLRQLSTEPPAKVFAALREDDRARLIALFTQMRSGSGFVNDLRATPDVTRQITQPVLVIATRTDGSVPFAQAESLAATIRGAQLVVSTADSHFIWFAGDYPSIAEKIHAFLGSGPSAVQSGSERSPGVA